MLSRERRLGGALLAFSALGPCARPWLADRSSPRWLIGCGDNVCYSYAPSPLYGVRQDLHGVDGTGSYRAPCR